MSAKTRLLGVVLAGTALAALPVGIGLHRPIGLQIALAHGSGAGGGGAGGGNGGGGGHAAAGHAAAGEANGHPDAHASPAADDGFATAPANAPAAMQGKLSAALAALNAAHAAPPALAHASPHSRVGKIAAYRSNMLIALAMPTNTPQEVIARDNAIAEVRASMLAPAANRSLTPAVVSRVDHLLGLPPSDPTLGVTP
jgi:hypothetical protein